MAQQTAAEIRAHYEIEKQIAARLRVSSPQERRDLYAWAYDELARRVPTHPCLNQKYSVDQTKKRVAREMLYLEPFLRPDTTFLEVGPGDCAVSLAVAERVRKVYAIDVSAAITRDFSPRANFELILSDGTSIEVPPGTVDFAYSNQTMEHLHPDDARQQLTEIFRALKHGGSYYCSTPNRVTGPHDVSRHFDPVATGLHLKEYTLAELNELFKAIGFSKTRVYTRIGRMPVLVPVFVFAALEKVVSCVPNSLRMMLTRNRVVQFALGIKLIGTK